MLTFCILTLLTGVQLLDKKVATLNFVNNRAAIVRHYIEAGALEQEELQYHMFKYADSFYVDIQICQRRLERLEADAPPFTDVHFLPNSEQCWKNKELAGDYQRYLERKLRFAFPLERDYLIASIQDVEWRREFWAKAYAVGHHYDTKGHRILLQEMRAHVGRLAYDNQLWPEPLPPAAEEELWK